MTQNEWQAAFGKVPQGFEARVRHTVTRMQAEDPAPSAKLGRGTRPSRLALLMALLLLLLAGTAWALSSLGVLDTLSENLRQYLLPEAERLVQVQPEQNAQQPALAKFTVEEAINDGRQLYITLRASAIDLGKTLLMDFNAEPSWGIDWWKNFKTNEGDAFSTVAHESGRALVTAKWTDFEVEGVPLEENGQSVRYDGEEIVYGLSFQHKGGDLKGTLGLMTNDLYGEGETRQWGSLSMNVPVNAISSLYRAATPVELPAAGIVLTEITVEQTPIATYVEVAYRPMENATDLQLLNMQDGLWCRWLDESGQAVPQGNGAGWLLEEEDTIRQEDAYRAFAEMPAEMTLEFYNGMTKERFDKVTLLLMKAGE